MMHRYLPRSLMGKAIDYALNQMARAARLPRRRPPEDRQQPHRKRHPPHRHWNEGQIIALHLRRLGFDLGDERGIQHSRLRAVVVDDPS